MVRVWIRMTMVMVVVMVVRIRVRVGTVVVVGILCSSPFAVVGSSLHTLTPRTSTLHRWPVSSAVARITLTIFGRNSKMAALSMSSWLWSWVPMGWSWFYWSQIIWIWCFSLALPGPVLLAITPRTATL